MSQSSDAPAQGRAGRRRRKATETRLLRSEQITMSRTAGGFLALEIREARRKVERYARINAFRAFPMSAARELISLRDEEGEEIGMIERLDDLPPDQARLVEEELDQRYFTPIINSISSLKEEFGYSYWETATDAGKRRFTVQSGKNNVIALGDRRLIIIDVDGNRFEVPDYSLLDVRTLRTIETLI